MYDIDRSGNEIEVCKYCRCENAKTEIKGQKPIESFDIYHGYDQDVNTWFVEIQIPKFGSGQILQWFKNKT